MGRIHICITYLHTHDGVAQRFLDDMRDVVAEIMKDPKADVGGSVISSHFFLSIKILAYYIFIFIFTIIGVRLWHIPEYSRPFHGR